MRLSNINLMEKGYFVGDFIPVAFRTSNCEVGIKRHPKGSYWPRHYHKVATEINCLWEGAMTLDVEEPSGKRYIKKISAGHVFTVEPMEIVKPHFDTDCIVIVVKVPGVLNDKVEVLN